MTELTEVGEGAYKNLYHKGRLRVSSSEQHDEIYVYRDGQEVPEAVFCLSTGKMVQR
jgi:hypothetical protein